MTAYLDAFNSCILNCARSFVVHGFFSHPTTDSSTPIDPTCVDVNKELHRIAFLVRSCSLWVFRLGFTPPLPIIQLFYIEILASCSIDLKLDSCAFSFVSIHGVPHLVSLFYVGALKHSRGCFHVSTNHAQHYEAEVFFSPASAITLRTDHKLKCGSSPGTGVTRMTELRVTFGELSLNWYQYNKK